MSDDLEQVWEYREEVLYPRLFGNASRGIFVLEHTDFAVLGRSDCDPRWLFMGVFEYAPTEARSSWVYVTSGGSTPWEETQEEPGPDDYSWLGFELIMETATQADWAIRMLKRLFAFQVLSLHGHYGDRPGLRYGGVFPLRGPIDQDCSTLDHVILTEPRCCDVTQRLSSGNFEFMQIVGLGPAEAEHARRCGPEELFQALEDQGSGLVIDPARAQIDV